MIGPEKRLVNWLAATFLLSAAILVFLPIINDYPVADDFGHLFRLADMRFYQLWDFFTIQSRFFIRPVPFYQIWLFDRLFGFEWLPSHLLNVVMHGLSGVVLFRLFDELGAKRITSFLAATLFVLSPLSPEAVSWTAGRFDVWSLLFILLSMLLYVRYMKKQSPAYYISALVAATVALLSKESALILFVVIPAMELLFGGMLRTASGVTDTGAGTYGTADSDLIRPFIVRIAPFAILGAGYLALRLAILGTLVRSPSYMQTWGMPKLKAPLQTLFTMCAPLDRLVVSRNIYLSLGAFVGALCLASLILVLTRWKKVAVNARRLWLLMMLFFISSLVPIYSSFFVTGMGSYLTNSRFFYITNIAFLSLMVIGLLEFGFETRKYRAIAALLLTLLIPVYVWGLYKNNTVWEDAAAISFYIPGETQRLLPDPPPGANLYFRNVPRLMGAHIYASALEYVIPLKYGREDIHVYYVDLDPALADHTKDSGPAPPDAYLFAYDWDTGTLTLEQSPQSAAGS